MTKILANLNINKSCTITKNGKSITLCKKAISTVRKNKKFILSDLKNGKSLEKLYMQNEMTKVFTKIANISGRNSMIVDEPKLYIVKNTTEINLDKADFVDLLLRITSLMKSEQPPRFKLDHFYPLARSKKFKIESMDNTFTIINEEKSRSTTLPLSALAKLVEKKEEIFADLQRRDDFKKQTYCQHQNFRIYTKPFNGFRILCFDPGFVCIMNNTFRKLVQILGDFFGEENSDDYPSEDDSEEFGQKLRISSTKTVQFSKSLKECFLTCVTDRKQELRLPTVALDALLELKCKILADLTGDVVQTFGYDFINEYWRNGKYTICTAEYKGEYVIRFTEKKTNNYIMSMGEKAFANLLDIYKKEKN